MTYRLPRPSPTGVYWLEKPGQAPAIMPIQSVPELEGKFLLVLPGDDGVVFDPDNRFRAFGSPQDALVYLLCYLEGRKVLKGKRP